MEKKEEEGSGRKVGGQVKTPPQRHRHWRQAQRQDLWRQAACHATVMSASSQDLGARIYGAETCKLGVTKDGAELRVQILKSYLQRHIYEKI